MKFKLDKIFRAYDIRGIYPDDFNERVAYLISQEIADFLKAKTLVVGMDARISSSSIASAIIKGIEDSGGKVIFLGRATTPLLYFAVNFLDADGGIMVTASHNPPEYNGLKIVGKKSEPIGADGLEAIKSKIQNQKLPDKLDFENLPEASDVIEEYINFLLENSGFKVQKTDKFGEIAWQPNPYDFKVGIDTANGMAGVILPKLFEKLKINYVPLCLKVDDSSPNHESNPSKEENIRDLKDLILKEKLNFGVTFDGDGDRAVFLDKKGNVISSSSILLLLTKELIPNAHLRQGFGRASPKAMPAARGRANFKVVYDITMSKIVKEQVESWGGEAIKSRVGHTFLKQRMREVNAVLGGEYTGHFYFKEMNYSESAILAMLKIFYIISKLQKPLDELVEPFNKYFNSGRINFELKTEGSPAGEKQKIMELLESKYSDAKIDKTDGLTIEYDNWRFNIRSSNTESVMRLIVETKTKDLLSEKVRELRDLVTSTQGLIFI